MKLIRPGNTSHGGCSPWLGRVVTHAASDCGAQLHVEEDDIEYKSKINGVQQRGKSMVVCCPWCKQEFDVTREIPIFVAARIMEKKP